MTTIKQESSFIEIIEINGDKADVTMKDNRGSWRFHLTPEIKNQLLTLTPKDSLGQFFNRKMRNLNNIRLTG
jgi:hypothetical protein